MDKERLLYLLQQYITGKANKEEEEELFDRPEFPETEETLMEFLEERCNDLPLKFTYHVTPGEDLAWDKMWARMQAATKHPQDILKNEKLPPLEEKHK
jgi:hypothetical protein